MSPPTIAEPDIEISSPMQHPIMPLSRLPSDNAEIRVSPNTASQKYSTGPKARANSARGGARRNRNSAPTKPPQTDAKLASDSARSPSPRLAIGKPSKVVAMAEGVPGV